MSGRIENAGAWRAWAIPACVFALVAAGSGLGWLATERAEEELVRTENELGGEQIALRIEDYLRTRLNVVMQVRDLTLTLDEGAVDPDAFVAKAEIARQRYPEIVALNWVDADGLIRQVVPHGPNVAALGRDLSRHPVAAEILSTARESGELQITPPVDLFQGGRGFAVYVPTIRDGRLLGFVNAAFRIAPLIEDCLARGVRGNRFYTLRDGDEALYAQDGDYAYGRQFAAEREFRVADRTWTLRVYPTPLQVARSKHSADEFVLLFGLVSAGVLAYSTRRIMVRRRQVASSRERLRRVVQDMPAMICRYRPDTTLTFVNQAYALHVGRTPEELIGTSFLAGYPVEERREALDRLGELTRERPLRTYLRDVASPGQVRQEEWRDRALFDPAGREVVEYQSIGVDVTERRQLERRLRQAQKMEAIGTLAGGVAHDFNNILTAIMGHAGIARSHVVDGGPAAESLRGIEAACNRAVDVTRGLLTFSRDQGARKRQTELGGVVTETLGMLRPILPAAIDVRAELPQRDAWVEIDRTQMQQVLMNLALNARDAMPDGGPLTISLSVRPADEGGDGCALLVVSDAGVGMSPEVRERVIEPFFTTKTRERGTGLGMAVVHGIVVEHGGRMEIDSTPGAGTEVSIRLPLAAAPALERPAPVFEAGPAPTGGCRVLLVEDDEQVRNVFATALRRAGHRVREVGDGLTARDLLVETPDAIDAVVLDIDLPKLSGTAVLTQARAAGCGAPVVLVSGNPSHGMNALPDGVTFLRKPFGLQDLTAAVARMVQSTAKRPTAV